MRSVSPPTLLGGAALVLVLGSAAPSDQIQWAASYADAEKTAQEKDSLILADFYTDW